MPICANRQNWPQPSSFIPYTRCPSASKRDGFAFDDLKRHVEWIYPNRRIETATLKLGLYLAKDFSVLTSYRPPGGTEITLFQIGEGAISMADPGTEWEK